MEIVPSLTKPILEDATVADTAVTTKRKTRQSKARKSVASKLDNKNLKDPETNQDLFSFISRTILNRKTSILSLTELSSEDLNKVFNFVYLNCFTYGDTNLMHFVHFLQAQCRHTDKNFSTVGMSCSVCGYFEPY